MKKRSWLIVGLGVTAVFVLAALSVPARAQTYNDFDGVAGYVQDTEAFPDMLHTVPDCADVYSEYVTLAHSLQACQHLDDAKEALALQQSFAKQLGELKKCKGCKAKVEQAQEAAMTYNDEIDVYGKQCPANRNKAAADYGQKVKEVCKKCKNKWPGLVGPTDKTPCN